MSLHRVILLDSAARNVSGLGPVVDMAVMIGGASQFTSGLMLLVVSAVSGTLPTLDAFIQMELPNGDYDDLVVFAQVTGVSRRKVVLLPTPGHTESPISDANLKLVDAKGLVLGAKYRAKWTIGGVGPSFTFSVLADLYD